MKEKETTRPITGRHMQVSESEIGEATARGTMADGAACKGNHQKAEGASHVCLSLDMQGESNDDLRRGRPGADASHTADMSGRR